MGKVGAASGTVHTELGPVVIIARNRKRFAQLVTTFSLSCKMTRWPTLMEPGRRGMGATEGLGIRHARRTGMERRKTDTEAYDDAFLKSLFEVTNSALALIALNASLTPLVTQN